MAINVYMRKKKIIRRGFYYSIKWIINAANTETVIIAIFGESIERKKVWILFSHNQASYTIWPWWGWGWPKKEICHLYIFPINSPFDGLLFFGGLKRTLSSMNILKPTAYDVLLRNCNVSGQLKQTSLFYSRGRIRSRRSGIINHL